MHRFTRAVLAAGALAALVVAPGRPAHAVEVAPMHGMVTIDGEQHPFALPLGPDGIHFEGEQRIITDGGEVHISFDGDMDPSIAYGIAVVDIGMPSTFGFVFAIPIVPTGPGTTVTGSIVGGLTDFTGDGVSITPFGGPTVQRSFVGFPLTNMGVDVGPALATGGTAGALYPYGPHAAGPQPGPISPPGGWTWLQVDVGFTLSGGGDIAALTGFASVETAPIIPEPTSLAVLGVGALGFLRRRRAAAR